MSDSALTLTDTQNCHLGPVTAVDKKGNPTKPAGPVKFASSDTTILTIVDNGDGSADVSAVGPTGASNVTATDGVSTATCVVTVVGGPETGLAIPAGTPTEQP